MDEQGGACAVCLHPFSATPFVDHDHVTGRVRGLLCDPCNKAIGFLRDDPVIAMSVVMYLIPTTAERFANLRPDLVTTGGRT